MNEIQVISKLSLADKSFNYKFDGFELQAHYLPKAGQEVHFSEGSVYLFIQDGQVELTEGDSSFIIGKGYYLSRKAPVTLQLNQNSHVVLIHTPAQNKSLNAIGGPVEDLGRLKYIDGCSDTLLLPPVLLGEPCLNFLHFPASTKQTMHNHPSFRFGMITRGNGFSISEHSEQVLSAGDIFFIPTFVNHKFDTSENIMDVIAFHPDSDWGPTDEVHPMINRTWVNGKKI